jgi:hypothetical protein
MLPMNKVTYRMNRKEKETRLLITLAILCAFLIMAVVPQSALAESAEIDVLFDGTVFLAPGETFTVTAYNSGQEYTVKKNTPLGALHAASVASGFSYEVTDKNYENSGALLLDNIGDYNYVKGGSQWYAYVNGVLKDGYNKPEGALNLIELVSGD